MLCLDLAVEHLRRPLSSSPRAAATLAPLPRDPREVDRAVSTPQLEFASGCPPANNLLITYHDELWHASINKGLR